MIAIMHTTSDDNREKHMERNTDVMSKDNVVTNVDGVEMKTYESIIDELGGIGYWQLLLFVFISVPDIFSGTAQMLPVYTG